MKKNRLSLGIILLIEVSILAIFLIYTAFNKDREASAIGQNDSLIVAEKEAELPDSQAADKTDSEASDHMPDSDSGNGSEASPDSDSGNGSDASPDSDSGNGSDDMPDGNSHTDAGEYPAGGSSAGEGDEGSADEDVYDTITISAAGDVTLGRDKNYGYERSFDHEFEKQGKDYSYFFRNVRHIFEADDLTIVNLETTLTNADKPAEKKFRFRADPSYVEILKQGDIEAVSIANNHTLDYLEKGYIDTINTLKEAEVGYFGYEHSYIADIRGIKIGMLGYKCWSFSEDLKKEVADGISSLKEEGADLVIIMFHWGIERDYYPNSAQKKMARFAIDSGADLVLGCHPHVLQGTEEYKGKSIVYSLGNFCFGGNKNPDDKDTMIYIHRFNFKNGELVSQEYEIIPCSISSVRKRNNYQPTPLEGNEAVRVLNKIKEISNF